MSILLTNKTRQVRDIVVVVVMTLTIVSMQFAVRATLITSADYMLIGRMWFSLLTQMFRNDCSRITVTDSALTSSINTKRGL